MRRVYIQTIEIRGSKSTVFEEHDTVMKLLKHTSERLNGNFVDVSVRTKFFDPGIAGQLYQEVGKLLGWIYRRTADSLKEELKDGE